MISERTLRQWRKQSLQKNQALHGLPKEGLDVTVLEWQTLNDRILRLTQELLDQYLLRKD